ncbi:MAG: hypothetical protein GXP27_07920 [Planctomycetes bacterium]|nr:hypothetical protein [Planctomycetota bacterium]
MSDSSTEHDAARPSGDQREWCWVLVGSRRGRVWYMRRLRRSVGRATNVEFDGLSVLEREERRGDVVGFFHTHPSSPAAPSQRDVDTMRAWVSAFGKPLLCVIEGVDGLAGYRFDDDRSKGVRLPLVEKFPRGVVIGVEDDAR